MPVRSILLACWLGPLLMAAQPLTPQLLTELPPLLQEVSGILRVDGETWVCLDSGNPNRLYQVDTLTGNVLRELELSNATNVDWEELTADEDWVYVGDIGNNAGTRTDLRFYRFPRAVLSGPATAVIVDTIRFHYADQDSFTPIIDGTNWDAEAVVAFDDSLFLFTKNWTDERTHLYTLSSTSGEQVAIRRGEWDTQGLVTGAVRDPLQGDLVLLGHDRESTEPFLWAMCSPVGHALFSGTNVQYPVIGGPMQAEAIGLLPDGRILIGNEGTPDRAQALWTLVLPLSIPEDVDHAARIFPIPADRQVMIEGADPGRMVRILDLNGMERGLVRVGQGGVIDLPLLPSGEYVLDLHVHSVRCRAPLLILR